MSKDSNIPSFGDGLKKNPFSTPHGYFDQLPSRIQDRCAKPELRKSWRKTLVPQLSFAAGFVVLVLIAKVFFSIINQTPEKLQDSMAQAADTSVYYDENGNLLFVDEDMAVDDAIISYLVDNNINDLDIVQ